MKNAGNGEQRRTDASSDELALPLEREGYGAATAELTPGVLEGFLSNLGDFEKRLAGYEQDGNELTLRTIEDHMVAAADGKPVELRRARRLARMRLVGHRKSSKETTGTEVEES